MVVLLSFEVIVLCPAPGDRPVPVKRSCDRSNDVAVSQVQASTTALTRARTVTRLPAPTATPTNADEQPDAGHAGEGRPATTAARPRTGGPAPEQASAKATNPTPPNRKCSIPCQLMTGSAGDPTGNPPPGSARKVPAPTRLTP